MKDEKYTAIKDINLDNVSEKDFIKLKPIIYSFIESYKNNRDKDVKEWLIYKLKEELPKVEDKEVELIANDIIETIETNDSKRKSLDESLKRGRSMESWFANEVKKSTSMMSVQESVKYLESLDLAISNANKELYNSVITKAGNINQNPRLDGFIAEQYHAQTFNLNAKVYNSEYKAKVLEPNGSGYKKNSVDIVVLDKNNKIVQKYQSKYCKDAKATQRAFEHGDYRGQQKLVPKGQEVSINKKVTPFIKAPDGIKSNELTKQKAEWIRDEVQSGYIRQLDWNEYTVKDLAIGISKETGYAALQGACITTGYDVALKLCNGEKIETDEIIGNALASGTDIGIKAAASGALKVGVEKGVVKSIPKGTSAGTIANIAYVGVENVKIVCKVASGELTVKEGLEEVGKTAGAVVVGNMARTGGAAIGAAIGTTFGPVGTVVGGVIGGVIGCVSGSKIGEKIGEGASKLASGAVSTVKKVASEIGKGVVSAGKAVFSGVASFFGF